MVDHTSITVGKSAKDEFDRVKRLISVEQDDNITNDEALEALAECWKDENLDAQAAN